MEDRQYQKVLLGLCVASYASYPITLRDSLIMFRRINEYINFLHGNIKGR